MNVRMIAIAVVSLFFASSAYAGDRKHEAKIQDPAMNAAAMNLGAMNAKDVSICAAVGGTVGAATSIGIGGMGLALLGTAISIGLAPLVVAGAIVAVATCTVYDEVTD